ncbi:hypothetical protein QEH52_17700, partial [Coraliomargarita sp. SDUM461003]
LGNVLLVSPLLTSYCLLARRASGPGSENRGYGEFELELTKTALFGIKPSLGDPIAMTLKNLGLLSLNVGLGLTSFFSTAQAETPLAPDLAAVVAATQEAHGLQAWWEKEVVLADVEIVFGGNTIVDGTFSFEAHGPRARYDRKDGTSVIFDGQTAWVSPAEAEAPKGRFHVLTWPWFIMAPFKMQGDGINLSDLDSAEVDGTRYQTVFQTFGEDMGDTPDDWYRFYLDPKTKLVDGMAYIVTFGKDLETANEKPSIIKYFDYVDAEGPVIATRYEFWYWDSEQHAVVGDAPKGVGTVSNVRYSRKQAVDFSVPADARELPLK